MALRRFLFQTLAAGVAYFDSNQDADEIQVAKITVVTGVGGVGLALGTTDITGARDIGARTITLTGNAGIAIDAGGARVTNLGAPTANGDATTKQYVDNLAAGVDWKASVRVAMTTNLVNPTTAPGATIDGIAMVAGDRFLLTGQTAPAENGIYVWTNATSAARSADASAGTLTSGAAVFVAEGTSDNKAFILITNDPITVGTTGLTWSQFVGPGSWTQGNGISITGNTISAAVNTSKSGFLDGSGIGVTVDPNGGIEHNGTTGLRVKRPASSGLTEDGTGLYVGAGVGISVGATTIAISLTAGDGITVSGATITNNIDTNAGLQFDASSPKKVQLKLSGTTLQVAAGGVSVKGLPSLFEINAAAVSANVTAANLNALTGGGATTLHTHSGLGASAVSFALANSSGAAITKGDPIYASAADTGAKAVANPATIAQTMVIGVAAAAVGAPGVATPVTIQTDGVLAGAGSGWTAGQQIFLANTGGLTNDPTGLTSRYRTIMVGIAVNATDLAVSVRDFGMKP